MPVSASPTRAKSLRLDSPIQFVKGIGPRRAEQLAKLEIKTVGDLLEYPPFRYEDRTRFHSISALEEGVIALVRGQVWSLKEHTTRRRGFSIFEMVVRDSTGRIPVKFFNQPYLGNVYRMGMEVIVYGPVRADEYAGGSLSFLNPEVEILQDESGEPVHVGRVVPIYRKLGVFRSRTLRQVLHTIVTQLRDEPVDPLPAYLRQQYRLSRRLDALIQLHFPVLSSGDPERRRIELEALQSGISPAHKRFILEELFELQVGIRLVRARRARATKTRKLELKDSVRNAIKRILPFHPTRAQKRALGDIAADLASAHPMSRLLQGDVGSGKTIVAVQAAIIAVENGCQTAIMAPTEILAEQHYFYFRRVLEPIGYRVGLLKGSLRGRQKHDTQEGIRSGEIKIAVGTHALIQEAVEFQRLALVIIDEQHRFGVMQRNLLREKGSDLDMLLMTATPIPRSLALTLYGDLDVSVIDELPPGRRPIRTLWLEEGRRSTAYDRMRAAVSAGQQVYVVYPLVEESEKMDLRAACAMARHLQDRVFPQFCIGLLHGQLKSTEKEDVMARFGAGEIQILVATTVIEVGVDVPNATLMVVEHAERFGLAQLHQLRGRVGRGRAQSECILIGNVRGSELARRRLEILCQTNDGFRIAETDLELRGPGEVLGTRQAGLPVFRYANLVRDRKVLELAQKEADRFLERLRTRPDEDSKRVLEDLRRRWQGRFGAALVG